MKVSELIAKLQAFHPDAVVTVTDSSCCGCSCAPIDEITEGATGGVQTVFLDGDRYAKEWRQALEKEWLLIEAKAE